MRIKRRTVGGPFAGGAQARSSILPLRKSMKRLRRGLVAPEAKERASEAKLVLLFSSSMATSSVVVLCSKFKKWEGIRLGLEVRVGRRAAVQGRKDRTTATGSLD
jgi:hypothetical protein